MDSLNTIVSRLSSIADSLNLSGPVINSLVQLLANSIYNNETSAVSAVLEASPSRCRMLNSAIKHAYDSHYSVPRGRNQRITFHNLVPLQTTNVKAYDLLGKVNNLKLYYAQDYSFLSNVAPGDITVIVGNECIEEDLEITNLTYLSSTGTNISEDIMLFLNNEPVVTTSFFNQFGTSARYMILTDTDYSVDILSADNFVIGNEYKIKYIPYITDTIPNLTIIKQLPNFQIKGTVDATSTSRIGRLENNELISYNAMVVNRTAFVIRSTQDIEDLVRNYFSTQIKGLQVIIDTTPDPDAEHGTNPAPYGRITIYYLMEDVDLELTEEDINEFKQNIVTAYYIQQEIEFIKATEYKFEESDDTQQIKLTVVYDTTLVSDDITNTINSYQYNIGGEFNIYKVIAELISTIDNVMYINVDPESIIKVDLPDGQFLRLDNRLNINYESNLNIR